MSATRVYTYECFIQPVAHHELRMIPSEEVRDQIMETLLTQFEGTYVAPEGEPVDRFEGHYYLPINEEYCIFYRVDETSRTCIIIGIEKLEGATIH